MSEKDKLAELEGEEREEGVGVQTEQTRHEALKPGTYLFVHALRSMYDDSYLG